MASVDKGKTQYVGVITQLITETTSSITGSFPAFLHGTYSTSSMASSDFASDNDKGPSAVNSMESYGLPTPPVGSTSTFKMTGYYSTTNVWETWTSTGTPNITPPSGHTLTFITYVVTSGAAN